MEKVKANVFTISVDCHLYETFCGIPITELSTTVYVRRAFALLGNSYPEMDTSLFSSSLEDILTRHGKEDERDRIRRSVGVLFYSHLSGEGEPEERVRVASGLCGIYLLEVLKDIWDYHEENGVDMTPDAVFRKEVYMHELMRLMFEGRKDISTADMLFVSSSTMAARCRKRGDKAASIDYLIRDVEAADFLESKGELKDKEILATVATLHVIKAEDYLEDHDLEMMIRECWKAKYLFEKAGEEESGKYSEYVEGCSVMLDVLLSGE